jgi:hypothetical protein
MNKTTNKYTPEVRERAVRMVLNGEGQHESRWAAIVSISAKIGCAPQTLQGADGITRTLYSWRHFMPQRTCNEASVRMS